MSVFWHEISRTTAVPARDHSLFGPMPGPILLSLTGEQKQRYLDPVLRGEKKRCFAQTEPDAGSDPGGMRTRAGKGDHYVINGTKRFITGANKAHFMQLMAATDRAKGSHGGISCFLVDMDTPGVKLGTSYQTMMGDRPWEIILDNVRVPAENLVGEEGEGFGLAQKWLGAGRVKHGARASASPSAASKWRRPTPSSARPSARRSPSGRRSSGSSRTCISSCRRARLLVYKAATRLDAGEDAREDCYVCKILRRRDGVPRRRRMHAGPRRHRRSPPTCRSRSSGASSAATASPKGRPKCCARRWRNLFCGEL